MKRLARILLSMVEKRRQRGDLIAIYIKQVREQRRWNEAA